MLPKKSEMMDALYGKNASQIVYDRCQTLSPKFNELVQQVVYDVFWARPGLTLKEKSIVTILTLITLNKEEQLRIHFGGFFHLGGRPNVMAQIINYMTAIKYINSSDKALEILTEVVKEKGLKVENINDDKLIKAEPLSEREQAIVDLVAHIALAEPSKTRTCMNSLLEEKILSQDEIENIMLHEMVYSGFPCAMNGFAILKSILDEKPTFNQSPRARL